MAFTYDRHTIDASGAFMVGELERLDKTLHMPLASVSWNRDIDLRSDVSMADEASSFTNTSFAAAGGINPNGKNWISGTSTEISGIHVDITKTPAPLRLWGMQLGFTLPELMAAEQLGRPLDTQKFEGLKLKHNMDVDEMVYIGDAAVGATGLVNNPSITPNIVTKTWQTATPEQILDDINGLIEAAWMQSGFALCPTHVLLAPKKYAKLVKPVTAAGSKSILQYVTEECLCNSINGRPLQIRPVKWLEGRGENKKDRAIAYTKGEMYVRYPLVPLQHTPVEYRGIHQLTTYFGRLGEVEFVYPETVAYADGM